MTTIMFDGLPASAEAPSKPSLTQPVDYRAWLNQTGRAAEPGNAAELYHRAIEAAEGHLPAEIPEPKSVSGAQSEALEVTLADAKPALDLLAEASRQPSCLFPMVAKNDSPFEQKWGPDGRHAVLRKLGKLLAIRARLAALGGRPREAVDDLSTILRIARQMMDQPSLVDYLIGLGCAESAYQQLALTSGSSTQADIDYLLDALEKNDNSRIPSPDRALDGELAAAYDRLQRFLKDVNNDGLMDGWGFPGERPSFLKKPMTFDQAVERTTREAQRWKAILSEPLLPRAMLDADSFVRELDADQDGLDYGFPRLGGLVAQRGRVRTRQCGAPVVARLHAFKLKHAKWPKDLAELAAEQPGLPLSDVFAPSGEFRYRLEDTGPVLYSIGPNGRDDGGRSESSREGDVILWPL